jgi:hypothetical protein
MRNCFDFCVELSCILRVLRFISRVSRSCPSHSLLEVFFFDLFARELVHALGLPSAGGH